MIVDYFRFRILTSKKFASLGGAVFGRIFKFLMLSSMLIYGACLIPNPNPPNRGDDSDGIVKISFLEVGQGDATLLSCPDKKHFTLIDAGESNSRYPGAETLFARALQQRMPKNSILELAINTHPHQDHLYGFLEIIKKHQQKQISLFRYLDNGGDDSESLLEEKIRGSLEFLNIDYINARTKSYWRFAPCPTVSDLYIDVLYPEEKLARSLGCPKNLNDCSLVVAIRRGTFSLVIMGDATVRWESAVLENKLSPQAFYLIKDVDVLRLGHHGSSSTSQRLLNHSKPENIILSTGEAKKGSTSKYRFPQSEVIRRIQHYAETRKWPEGPKIAACSAAGGRISWEELNSPNNLWSTARDGSIELLLGPSSYEIKAPRK